MVRAFISVGSNINPAQNTAEALYALSHKVRIMAISTVYLTHPENRPEQPCYYNCVVEIETDRPVIELKHMVNKIEDTLGRVRSTDKYAARTIDLDILLYGNIVMETSELNLPAPDILSRPFLAVPLQELAPGLIIPNSGERIHSAARMSETMKPLPRFTERIRREILYEKKP